ncbi:hypothetical protein V1511DRAFT_495724 [Dipodascopsis uninucleata]
MDCDKSCSRITTTVLCRASQFIFAVLAIVFAIMHMQEVVNDAYLMADTRALRSSGFEFTVMAICGLGSLSMVGCLFLASAYIFRSVDTQLTLYENPSRLISIDIAFLVFWSLSVPLLVIEYPVIGHSSDTYRLVVAICAANLTTWSASVAIDSTYACEMERIRNERHLVACEIEEVAPPIYTPCPPIDEPSSKAKLLDGLQAPGNSMSKQPKQNYLWSQKFTYYS